MSVEVLQQDVEEIEVHLETEQGFGYTGVLKGKAITEEDGHGGLFFQTTDGRVMFVKPEDGQVEEFTELGNAEDWQSMDAYVAVAEALGEDARVDL
jgi:hypothetical protein